MYASVEAEEFVVENMPPPGRLRTFPAQGNFAPRNRSRRRFCTPRAMAGVGPTH